jgi:hypothetical protein
MESDECDERDEVRGRHDRELIPRESGQRSDHALHRKSADERDDDEISHSLPHVVVFATAAEGSRGASDEGRPEADDPESEQRTNAVGAGDAARDCDTGREHGEGSEAGHRVEGTDKGDEPEDGDTRCEGETIHADHPENCEDDGGYREEQCPGPEHGAKVGIVREEPCRER